MLRPVDAGAQLPGCGLARLCITGAFKKLKLQLQGGNGGAQFMSSISQEVALQRQGAPQAGHQVVDRANQCMKLSGLC